MPHERGHNSCFALAHLSLKRRVMQGPGPV